MCYDIRLCEISEINIVLEFIDKYWKKDHIFLHRKDLLDWQHRESNHYNFVIAVHRKEKTIHGILGFISPTFFASGNVVKNDDIWLAIWKVEKELTSSNSVGIDLLNYIKENYTPSSISAIGINQNVANLYKIFLGFQLAKMNHYYLLNREKERYNIAKINRIQSSETLNTELDFHQIINITDNLESYSEVFSKFSKNKKKINYYLNRYQKHPIYKYGFYLLINDAGISGFFVGREIHHNNSKCFRITDISFKEIDANISRNTFEKFLREIDAEYIDLIYFSSKKSALDYLGFEENNAQDFVPHLFEPFVEDHIEVLLAYLSTEEVSFFKGDSDLDRPNQVI